MQNLKKDLQTVNREIKALSKKVDRMIVTVGKLEKPKAVKAIPVKKTVAKAKPIKAKAVKKTPVKKVASKKAAPKKAVPKKAATAADTVFTIIKRYRKGIDVSTLMGKTGFNRKKIYNNVKVLNKQGKIKSVGKGVYVKA